jgi:hypothetical protein
MTGIGRSDPFSLSKERVRDRSGGRFALSAEVAEAQRIKKIKPLPPLAMLAATSPRSRRG